MIPVLGVAAGHHPQRGRRSRHADDARHDDAALRVELSVVLHVLQLTSTAAIHAIVIAQRLHPARRFHDAGRITRKLIGRAVGAVVNGRLYLMLYDAARSHYYAAALPDVMCLSARDSVLPVVPMFHANAWGLAYAALMSGASHRFSSFPSSVA